MSFMVVEFVWPRLPKADNWNIMRVRMRRCTLKSIAISARMSLSLCCSTRVWLSYSVITYLKNTTFGYCYKFTIMMSQVTNYRLWDSEICYEVKISKKLFKMIFFLKFIEEELDLNIEKWKMTKIIHFQL